MCLLHCVFRLPETAIIQTPGWILQLLWVTRWGRECMVSDDTFHFPSTGSLGFGKQFKYAEILIFNRLNEYSSINLNLLVKEKLITGRWTTKGRYDGWELEYIMFNRKLKDLGLLSL